MEAAAEVRRKHHFFLWILSHQDKLLPNQIAICGAWNRGQNELKFEQFISIVLPDEVLASLVESDSPLVCAMVDFWVAGGGKPCVVTLSSLDNGLAQAPAARLLQLGVSQLLVHAVARPQRCNEIETMVILGAPNRAIGSPEQRLISLLMPHLHSTYLRVLAVEQEMNLTPRNLSPSRAGSGKHMLTRRELQVLASIRDGMSNQLISEQLLISPLTVKNHVQKMLRKLGAANRAQAVVRAIALGALPGADADAAAAALPGRSAGPPIAFVS